MYLWVGGIAVLIILALFAGRAYYKRYSGGPRPGPGGETMKSNTSLLIGSLVLLILAARGASLDS
jgi:hypothetical protein